MDEALAQAGYARNVGVVVPNFHIALSLLANNDLIAVLPERLLRTNQDDLHNLDLPIEVAPFDIVCVWPERLQTDLLNVWFRQFLRARLGDP
jgi:DNA-binding transcriptional LysR family regulator